MSNILFFFGSVPRIIISALVTYLTFITNVRYLEIFLIETNADFEKKKRLSLLGRTTGKFHSFY